LLTKSYGDANGFKQKLTNNIQFHRIESNRIVLFFAESPSTTAHPNHWHTD